MEREIETALDCMRTPNSSREATLRELVIPRSADQGKLEDDRVSGTKGTPVRGQEAIGPEGKEGDGEGNFL